jgi:hypothetical protein
MAKPKTVDPRLELVNFDVLDMDRFPPVEEWTEDDYEEAGLLTLAAISEAEIESGDGWLIPGEEIEAKYRSQVDAAD